MMHRQHENLAVRGVFQDLTCRIETIQLWKTEVHDHDIGPQALRHVDCLATGRRLAGNLPPGLRFEQGADTAANNRVIVNDEDA
jgi:hypothetical protein